MPRRDPLLVLTRVRRLALDAARREAAQAAAGVARAQAEAAALLAEREAEALAAPAAYAAWRPAAEARRGALAQHAAQAEAAAALARSALQKGARGFVHVGMQPSQIRRAILMVRKGELVVPREIITDLIRQEAPVDILMLTPRQREILQLVAEGLTNAQIARRLFLSEYTIKQHLRAAYKLLGVRNRTQAVRLYRSLEEE